MMVASNRGVNDKVAAEKNGSSVNKSRAKKALQILGLASQAEILEPSKSAHSRKTQDALDKLYYIESAIDSNTSIDYQIDFKLHAKELRKALEKLTKDQRLVNQQTMKSEADFYREVPTEPVSPDEYLNASLVRRVQDSVGELPTHECIHTHSSPEEYQQARDIDNAQESVDSDLAALYSLERVNARTVLPPGAKNAFSKLALPDSNRQSIPASKKKPDIEAYVVNIARLRSHTVPQLRREAREPLVSLDDFNSSVRKILGKNIPNEKLVWDVTPPTYQKAKPGLWAGYLNVTGDWAEEVQEIVREWRINDETEKPEPDVPRLVVNPRARQESEAFIMSRLGWSGKLRRKLMLWQQKGRYEKPWNFPPIMWNPVKVSKARNQGRGERGAS
jgi:hypothetical protein